MSVIKLLPRPTLPSRINVRHEESYWTKHRCSGSCGGHIIPFNRIHEISILCSPIDLVQSILVREKELSDHEALVNLPKKVKEKYTARKKPRPHIRIFGE